MIGALPPAEELLVTDQAIDQAGWVRSWLWVPETLHRSRHLLILVEQSIEPVKASDVVRLACLGVGEWS
jgi:hypothetical protein